MEGSSESRWEKSDSSRELNACVVSNRVGVSGDASNNASFDRVFLPHSDHLDNQVGSSGLIGDVEAVGAVANVVERGDVNLRQWLDKPDRSVDLSECLHMFRQIVETVNLAHAQGVVVYNVRPACFVMSSFNSVSFIESASCSSSGSDSFGDAVNNETVGGRNCSSPSPQDLPCGGSGVGVEDSLLGIFRAGGASYRASETSRLSSIEEIEENKIEGSRKVEDTEENKKTFPLKQILVMEVNWYTSPEELAGASSSFSSDIYRLGILLFELDGRKAQNNVQSQTSCSAPSVAVEVAKRSFILSLVTAPSAKY